MMKVREKKSKIKSPLNYIGGKYKLLDQILPLFPEEINQFIDLFAGGCNVGINVSANKISLNDNLSYLIDMYKAFQDNDLETSINHIEDRIHEFKLSKTNEAGYKAMRKLYNREKHPLDLFVLIAHAFNHQIRFNNSHGFNNPFGRNRSSFNANMKSNLKKFIIRLKTGEYHLSNACFTDVDFSPFGAADFVYCDPPYLITTGSYNDGKRGFKGWTNKEEVALLALLDGLNAQKIRFALSNVIEHKGQKNELLANWLENNDQYRVNYLDFNYDNANYQTHKKGSVEVLITNYKPPKRVQQRSLFDQYVYEIYRE